MFFAAETADAPFLAVFGARCFIPTEEDRVLLLTLTRLPKVMEEALGAHAELHTCRNALEKDGWGAHPDFTNPVQLKSGAKFFVPPHLVRYLPSFCLLDPCPSH